MTSEQPTADLCIDRLIGYRNDTGPVWASSHEWRQRWAVRVDHVAPDGFYCIHCLAVRAERTNADR